MNYKDLLAQQQHYFNSNATKDLGFRLEQLKTLKGLIKDYEKYENTINEDLHCLFEESLSKLDYLEFLEFFYEILVINNYTLGDNLICYLKNILQEYRLLFIADNSENVHR